MKEVEKYYGKFITACRLEPGDIDRLVIEFDDGVKIEVFDDLSLCCEVRYITCDDDPSSLVGEVLVEIEDREEEHTEEGEYGDHDWSFVRVCTDKDFITLCTHNDHNGYYGGFNPRVMEVIDG